MQLKIHAGLILTIEKLTLKYKWKSKGTEYPQWFWISGEILKTVDTIQLYNAIVSRQKSIGDKKNTEIKKIEDTLEKDPLKYFQLIFYKGAKAIQ